MHKSHVDRSVSRNKRKTSGSRYGHSGPLLMTLPPSKDCLASHSCWFGPVWTSVLFALSVCLRCHQALLATDDPFCCQSSMHRFSTNALGWPSPRCQLLRVVLCSAFFDVTFQWVHTWEELQGQGRKTFHSTNMFSNQSRGPTHTPS